MDFADLIPVFWGAIVVVLAALARAASRSLVVLIEKAEPLIAAWIGELVNKNGSEAYNELVRGYVADMIAAARDRALKNGWSGEEQLNYVVDQVHEYIYVLSNKYNLPFELSRENVENLVRGIYQAMKDELDQFEPGV